MKTSSKYRRNKSKVVPLEPKIKVWRIRFIQFWLYLIGMVIFLRLVQIQVFGHEKYEKMARDQYLSRYTQKAHRGLIYDRNLKKLALNKPASDLGFDKRQTSDYTTTSKKLAKILGKNYKAILPKLLKGDGFAFIQRQLEAEETAAIKALNLPGVKLIESNKRAYPMKEKFAQMLGFVNVDGTGISGLEYHFNDYLKGRDAANILQRDAKGRSVMPVQPSHEYKGGDDIILTIDHVIQTIVEEELAGAITRYKAKGGSVIVTDPQTGEILAMASYPGFDANNPKQSDPETWRIRCVTDIFEPGSTFKIVTLLAALSNDSKKMDDIIFCENGEYEIYGVKISDHKKHGWLNFRDVIKYSSNIGTAKMALDLGKEKIYEAARSLGFGNATGVDLPGEVQGILKNPIEWSRFSVAGISYGYEVAVTPLQMAMAYGAIANDGLLLKPYIVKKIRNSQTEIVKMSRPETIRRVMPAKTAQTMQRILKSVVEAGTGQQAKIPEISIAGKTGTARKTLKDKPGYSRSRYIASFAGFYPAENAEYLIFLMIDEPTTTHWGGYAAAPTFKKILTRILEVYKPITRNQETLAASTKIARNFVPDLQGKRLETAIRILDELEIKYKVHGKGSFVLEQKMIPAPGNPGAFEMVLIASDFSKSEYAIVPDLMDLSLRKAVSKLSLRGLNAKVFGSGKVVKQDPQPGAKIKSGAQCMIECRPLNRVGQISQN